MEHEVGEPAKIVDVVPGLVSDTLLSGSKFVDLDYISIYTPTEGNIYDVKITKYCYRQSCPKMFAMPKDGTVANSIASKCHKLKHRYAFARQSRWKTIIKIIIYCHNYIDCFYRLQILLDKCPDTKEAMHNVYNLPSIEPSTHYLHAVADFTIEST